MKLNCGLNKMLPITWRVCLAAMITLISSNPPLDAKETETDMQKLVEGNNAFALDLYSSLRSTEGNLVFSPYSISAALAMTYAGARGETARQMEQTLHFGHDTADLAGLFGRLTSDLQALQGSNELNIANSLWPQEKYPFLPEYLDLLKKNYDATIRPLNFQNNTEPARVTINQWVDDNTRHKISEIIGPGALSPMTRLVLVNAIYFKGTWATPFPETETRPDTFYTKSNATINAQFMHKQGSFKYGETDQLQLLALPYTGGQMEMTILLPLDRQGMGKLEASLTLANLSTWTSAMHNREVDVALPRFKQSSGFQLNSKLEGLGIKDAFAEGRADFSGMDGHPHWLYLGAALHKAFIQVNEKGTEAAAATAITIRAMAMRRPEPPKVFRADHPFLFLIRDSKTGSILFLGRVTEPEI